MSDLDRAITKRLLLKEFNIKRLTTKYTDLISKFNTLTRNEIKVYLKEILNEIDLIEISLVKSENIQKLEKSDKLHNRNISINIDNNIESIKGDIISYEKKLNVSKENKKYKLECEEIAKIVNKYETIDQLNSKINETDNENSLINKRSASINQKLKVKSNKMSLIASLIDELKSGFNEDEFDIDEDRMLK